MKISISGVRPAMPMEWDQIWRSCDYATYFHSREWAEVWSSYTTGRIRPEPVVIEFSDGKKGILPVSVTTKLKGLVKECISSPAGTFGGWISKDSLTAVHSELLVDFLTNKYAKLTWRLNPYDKVVLQVFVPVSRQDDTLSLSLSDDFEKILSKWTKGHSSAARKARKAGVSVRCATALNDWVDYYRIYENSLRRWGDSATSKYDWKLFHEFWRRKSPNIKLWLSLYEGNIIAGALCFYSKQNCVYWHGAALSEFFGVRPVNLLMYEAIRHACNSNLSWFDFNPSGGHEGVQAFKKSFGPTLLGCPVVITEKTFAKLLYSATASCKRLMKLV